MESTLGGAAEAAAAEVALTGRCIAPGLGMGRAWIVGDLLKCGGTPGAILAHQVDGELAHLKSCLDETLAELDEYAQRIEVEFDSTLAGVFRAHGEMLRDLFLTVQFEQELRTSLLSADAMVRRVLKRWYQKFEAIENQSLRQRADDLLDLGRNIVRRLRGQQEMGLASIPADSVLVVERLLPSDVVRLPKANVMAVIVETLGQGSHAALLAREKGIPTITEIPGLLSQVTNGTELLVDGFLGTLVIAPGNSTRAGFETRLEKWRATLVRCKGKCREPARTLDGQLIQVEANVGVDDDVEIALDNGADGVGLLRIEELYFARPLPPTEDELFAGLKKLIAPLGRRPITIRLLDIGGDKPLPYLRLLQTSNPVLGRRGVRLLLDYSQLVRTQLGAISRLSEEFALRVLIPMVTLEDDLRQMRVAFDAMCDERKISNRPEFGAMIETPAAALDVPALLKYVDFFCVGTNDLTQYTLAAARDDASVNDYYLDSHESIVRLLRIILADAGDRPVTLCGELAGREAWIPRLLEMGFRALSVSPAVIPTTKEIVRRVNTEALHAPSVELAGSLGGA
jgi:phosphoenolpyruvate-protein phosphotransferase (PTS system enzyme I)